MKVLTFAKEEKWALGIMTESGIIDVEMAAEMNPESKTPKTMMELVQGGDRGIKALEQLAQTLTNPSLTLNESDIVFGPVVPEPQKIICIGLNYRKHAEESGMPAPEYPLLFSKFSNALAGHKQEVLLPETVQQADYEAELAIVIGKKAANVKKEEALSYVFGYACANDLSSRDLQFRSSQWLIGKTCDGFCPIGPYLVTADEVEDPDMLEIQTYVNGEIRQNSNTCDMIFNCREIISYISEHMTLMPGDIILTGTPEGVIMGMPEGEKKWLQDGDEVEVRIEGLGSLTSRFTR